jgi:hypothetical protein
VSRCVSGFVMALLLAGMPWATSLATSTDAPAVLRASFSQERVLPGFRRPLRSEGEVLLVRGEGLRWATRAPFPSTLVVRGGRMAFRDAEGRRQSVDEGGHVAGLVQELLDALLSADRAALAKRFTLTEMPPPRPEAWALGLVPKGPPLNGLYERIEVIGGTHVERIDLYESSGARTTIRFHDTRVQAAAGDAERRALE